jgi:hypothetical protein
MTDKKYGDFHDSLTGIMVTRELTPEEIAELPQETPLDETPTAG